MGDTSNWIAAVGARRDAGLGGVTLRKSSAGTIANVSNTSQPLAVDRAKMSVRHVLVTKSQDLQGDIVDPVGADLVVHEANPVVFYDHREHYKHPIASASDGSGYTVTKSKNGELLYADTFFTSSDPVSNQLFGLVDSGLIQGWSVGFNPKPHGFEVIRKSQPGRDRGAFKFNSYTLLEYSLTPQPVNPDALTVLVEKGRLGSEALNPVILKSLTAHALTNRAAVVRVPAHPLTTKAMNDQTQPQDADPANADPYADDAGMDDGPQETPTVASLYDAAQGVMDLCANLEQAVAQSEHKGGKQFAASVCAAGQKLAAKIKAKADQIKAELGGEEPDADDEGGPADGDEDDMETDDDGGIVTKGGYRPKRWTTKGIQLANRVERKPDQSAAIAALRDQLLSIQAKLPAA